MAPKTRGRTGLARKPSRRPALAGADSEMTTTELSGSSEAAGRTRPRAFLLCGPSLAGKSGLAARLSALTGAAVVGTGVVDAGRSLPSGDEGNAVERRAEAWQAALGRLREALASGRDAVLDDTLCHRSLRDEARAAAEACGAEPVLVLVATPRDEILRRWEEGTSAGRPLLSIVALMAHLESFERPAREEAPIVLPDGETASEWLATLGAESPGPRES